VLAAPRHGFVFLSAPKSGSTALETAFMPYAQVVLKGPPRLKHTNANSFHRFVAPMLQFHGWERDSYEVVAVVREPVDWLLSWWRYRSRDDLRRSGAPQYAGHLSFEEWADEQIANDLQGIGRMSRFVAKQDGTMGVDRLWRYEHIDGIRQWMSERVRRNVEVPVANVSPPRSAEVPDALRRRLEEFLVPEYELYESAS
jgi:hypothetical protein